MLTDVKKTLSHRKLFLTNSFQKQTGFQKVYEKQNRL